ncbi:molybdopterin-dependent oxidoreductase [Microvirga calopogonii]|uniref:molybdopterin-dependent oxidoreductase n=1 Tax=Microvirga calopogonii TaxID=2078013 RepID=UPI000E0DE201|nr:molybdopterin-dependent oxidoreductase [Microvirga calopogonii]
MLGAKMRMGLLGTLVAFLGIVGAAYAASLPAPKERPILTISGKIDVTNKDGTAQFDRAMLEALGLVTIETTTPWYEGKVKFEGVPLDKLMKQVGAKGERVSVVALNDYATEIPIADFAKYNVILAIKRDGEYMPVRDKGPLFIVYPYDSNPELKSQTYYARSAWQVARIEVK